MYNSTHPHRHIPSMEDSENAYISLVLPPRKARLHRDLISKLNATIYAFSVLQFLKDTSLSKILLRLFVQQGCARHLDPAVLLLLNHVDAQHLRLSLLVLLAVCNAYCVCYSILCDLPKNTLNGFLIGEWSLQLIGERPPTSKWILVAYDMVVFILQVVLFASSNAENGSENEALVQDEYDGLQGDVVVARILLNVG